MTNWLNPAQSEARPTIHFDAKTDRKLRLFDMTLAGALMLLMGLPMMLTLLFGRLSFISYFGCNQKSFRRWHLDFSNNFAGALLRKIGADNWLVLLNILKGEMAWVGPRAKPVHSGLQPDSALHQIRPGLINLWNLRRHTAVAYGSETQTELEYAAQRSLRHDLGIFLRACLVAWLPLPVATTQERVLVGDVEFDNIDMTQALVRINEMLTEKNTKQVSFVNPACVNIAAKDLEYRNALRRAKLVLPDGIGIKIASDILMTPLKQNVNGTDLFPRLCAMLEARNSSIFLLGGHPGVAEKVASVIRQKWPNLRIAGLRDGYFDTDQESQVTALVKSSYADVLLVARGVPMQDVFIDRQLPHLGVKVAIGVGGLFDFVSGRINRAPAWMREIGLEWIYRLLQEPSRMWRRYLIGNFTFLGRILLQRLGLRRSAHDI